MTQHSTRTASTPPGNSPWGRLLKRPWPVRLVLVAALLLAIPFLFHAGSTVHAADKEITGVTLTSPNPGELAITWDAPSRAPDDYRVTWKKSDGKWPSYKNDNTTLGGNAFPTATSHTVTGLEEGTEYSVRVRARYHNSDGKVEQSGPWSDPPVEITVSSTPSKDGEGDSNEGRSTSPPDKPTGITYGATHNNVLMFWTAPDDDTITGYQVLRGPAADTLTVLENDTGSTDASYSDDTVEPETQYFYAIRARNAEGLGPQSDTVSVTTQAAPEELLTELALAGVEFIIAGQTLDTTGTCSEGDITQIAAECTENITNPMPQFGVVGTLGSNAAVQVNIGRDLAGGSKVADQSDLQGANKRITPTFQPGRNLLQIFGDEDTTSAGGGETHYFRINVVPYWELNGDRLSKDSDCQSTTARTAAQITDSDCILTTLNPAVFRLYNVINEHFNVYVDLNGDRVIREPDNTALAEPFTLDLVDGENVLVIRLAAKGSQPHGETYGGNSFYYKVTGTDVLVSNIGQTDRDTGNFINQTTWRAQQFTTGTNPDGYTVSEVVVNFESGVTGTFNFSIHQTDESGTFDVPGTKVVDLTGSPTTTGEHGFTPSNTTTLDPSTKYFVVFSKGTTGATALETTNSDNVDAVSANDWDMADKTLASSDSGSTWDERDYAIEIAVKGALVTISTDATLSDLVLFDSKSTEVTLAPTFDPEVTEYTATVANEHTRGSLDAQLNDVNAEVEFLDENDATIPTAGMAGDVRYINPNFDVGDNIFKIKVTAEDTTTTKTYQVTITRSAAAPDAPASLTASPGNAEATLTWTAPASDGGAAITKYQYRVSDDGGTTWSPDWTDVPDSDSDSDQADERTVTVTGLTNGTVHTFQVRAVNSEGGGSEAQDTATPAAFLVSNTAITSLTSAVVSSASRWAIQFTTGNNATGYKIDAVQLSFKATAGANFKVSIYSDSSGRPNSSLKKLTNPSTVTTSFQLLDFDADDYKLKANTNYWIVLERSSGQITFHTTESTAEDPGTAPGWSIGDESYYTVGSKWSASTDGGAPRAIPQLTIKGEPIKPAITLAADFTSIVRELHEVTFTLTRAGSTALAADVTLMVENVSGGSVIIASGRTETLTFAANDDTVEFAVPTFWIRAGRPTGSFVATVEAPAEYDASAATATVEVVNPTGTLIEVKLDQNSYNVTEGNELTYNVVFNVLEEIAAPNRDITFANLVSQSGTAVSPSDYIGGSNFVLVSATSWTLVADRYLATISTTLETKDDALYERPMGSHESFEIELQGTLGTPSWVLHIGPTTGTTRYPVTIQDNETLTLSAELSSTGLTAGQNLRIDEDAGEDVTLTVTNSDLASDGNPVTLPPGVKLKITPDIPTNRGATETDDWTISPDEIDLGGTATITIIDDMLEEGPESVTFEVGFDDDAAFQSARATLTIDDDEYTGPVLQTAAIDAAELTLEFSNTLDATSRPARSAFEVKVRGAAVSLSSSNPVSISGSTVTLRLGSAVTAGDTVTVSYTAPGTDPIKDDAALEAPSFTDEPVTNNTPNAPATGKPVISGTPQRAETLTVSTSGIRDADGLSNPRYTYQWVRVDGANEVIITGSNSPSYLLTRDDVGKKLLVRVAFFDDAGKTENLESDQFPSSGTIRNKPNNQPTGRPTLSGTHQVGHTLTADTSGIDDQDGLTNPGYTYQWQRREIGVYTDISGATQMVYTLTPDDQGKRVRVQVTFTDDDENVHTLESSPSGVVQAQTSLPSSKVKVSLDATAYVVEEGDTIQVTVTLAEAPEEDPVYIPFTVTPANGASRSDFAAWSSYTRQLRFDVGDTTDRINVHANDDTLNDDGETITLCLDDLPEPYATLAGLDCATINIMDNDDPNSVRVTFRSDTYWASEDGNPAWPRISVHPIPDRKITIPITYTRHGGLSEDDYEIVTTSVTFGPGLYGVHGDGHLSDNRTYASFPIEIWAIDDMEDDDGEYMDLAFGDLPPFVSAGGTGKFSYRPTTARVWFNDNEFTQVPVTDPPNPLGLSKRMRVTFADAELEAREGQYSNGTTATVRVRLSRRRDMESQVIIPIFRSLHGATDGVDFAGVPDHLIFLPGQTEQSFRVRAINDDVDDDGEYLTFSFGTLPELVYAGDQASVRVDLVDDDDPPVDVFFEQADYVVPNNEVTKVRNSRNEKYEYARLNVKVKLSAVPERFVDVGIVAKSIQGGGGIHFEYSAYIPRGPHDGAHFYADDTEFTLRVYISSARGGFDANQTYRLEFKGMSYRMFEGSPETATITINANR